MIRTILSPDEAKAARATVGLSQNKVALAVGISRTNLALFEVKKYLLDDETLIQLKQFYTNFGYEFGGLTMVEQDNSVSDNNTDYDVAPGVRLMDGFAIPEGVDTDEAENLLEEISDNDSQIEALSDVKPNVGWFSGEPDTEGVEQLLRLHARNYLLTRCLQGHIFEGAKAINENDSESLTNGLLFKTAIHG